MHPSRRFPGASLNKTSTLWPGNQSLLLQISRTSSQLTRDRVPAVAEFRSRASLLTSMLARYRSQPFAEESLEHFIQFRGNLSEPLRGRVKFIRPILFRIQNTAAVGVVHTRIRTGEICDRLIVHVYKLINYLLANWHRPRSFSLERGEQPGTNEIPALGALNTGRPSGIA
jgi:hypothetical protein